MFYLTYITKKFKIQNAFSQWGSFGHSILEKYYKGELELFELSEIYEDGYDENVNLKFPDNVYVDLNETYRAAGKKYFDNFEDDFSDYEVIGVEQKIEVTIGKYKFIGYIDLILKDDKGYYICDHKVNLVLRTNQSCGTIFSNCMFTRSTYMKRMENIQLD